MQPFCEHVSHRIRSHLSLAAKGALPHSCHTPPEIGQAPYAELIVHSIAFDLRFPELGPRAWLAEQRAVMPMPETTVHEHHGAKAGEHDVRVSGQVLCVQSKAEATTVQKAAHKPFGCSVLPAYSAHHAAAGGTVHYVHSSDR